MEKLFHLSQRGTTVRTEFIAGLTNFMAIAMMPFTYNVSYGIAFGILTFIATRVFTGKAKDITLATWVIAVFFAAMFFLTH